MTYKICFSRSIKRLAIAVITILIVMAVVSGFQVKTYSYSLEKPVTSYYANIEAAAAEAGF